MLSFKKSIKAKIGFGYLNVTNDVMKGQSLDGMIDGQMVSVEIS